MQRWVVAEGKAKFPILAVQTGQLLSSAGTSLPKPSRMIQRREFSAQVWRETDPGGFLRIDCEKGAE